LLDPILGILGQVPCSNYRHSN